MFPVGDTDVRGASLPIVSWVFIALNVLVFLYELSLGDSGLQQFFLQFGVVPSEIQQGDNLLSLLTSMFMHGGWAHILGNMAFLFVFGDNIEAVMGKVLYPIFYLAGGLAASFAHILFNLGSDIPSLGASGAIAAVMGAYAIMFPGARVKMLIFLGFRAGITQVSALVFLGIWFLTQLLSGVASLGPATAQTSGVAFWAHIGGFVFGLIVGVLFRGRAQQMSLESA
ncbi:MAG TPA: rhomboid family intramembrane serine protease [Anaerolineae bacterium]|nr:rhomboid family intramembrane serine protease [Anaerolineae bacterium]